MRQSPFWRTKRLHEMTPAEWESLCDGCGKCCCTRYVEKGGRISVTDVACNLIDPSTARCTDYENRLRRGRRFGCRRLTLKSVGDGRWLPPTCAYRLLAEGRDLPDWHPLVSGDPGSVVKAGISVAGKVVRIKDAGDPEKRIVGYE